MVPRKLSEAMFLAITIGDLDQVKRLVEHGVPVTSHQRTALTVAVEEEQIEIVNFLLCNGTDVNFVDCLGEPPLVLAVRSGNLEMIQLLLEAGADVNGCTSLHKRTLLKSTGTSPLHIAATEEDSDTLNTLLAANADVNTRNIKLETPLHLAAHSGHPMNIKRLIACGALLDSLDKQGYTPLHHAILEGHTECVRELCRLGCSVNLPTSQGYTPLMLAVSKHQMKSLRVILQFEPNLNHKDGHLDRTVLHTVIENCPHRGENKNGISLEIEMLDCLIHAGADVNITDSNEETPLHLCVQVGCETLMEYLIRCQHINVNTTNTIGYNPLMTACTMTDNPKMAELLIQYCPTLVRAADSADLMACLAMVSNLPCMELLLEAGYHTSRREAKRCQQIQKDNKAMVNFVQDQLLQPWPLLRLCRVVVRNCLLNELHLKTFQLPLPQELQKQILLQPADVV